MDNDQPVFLPYRIVAEFADGARLVFDGFTEEQARERMEDAQNQHGDIAWFDHVTDQNYTDGIYYKLLPETPRFPLPIIDLTHIDDSEALKKALQDPFIEDGAPE